MIKIKMYIFPSSFGRNFSFFFLVLNKLQIFTQTNIFLFTFLHNNCALNKTSGYLHNNIEKTVNGVFEGKILH